MTLIGGCGSLFAQWLFWGAMNAWLAPSVLAQDVANAFEPPYVGRYEGSVIKEQSVRAFDRTMLMTRLSAQGKFDGIAVEGRRTVTALQGPRGRSALEVFTNYANALKSAGFEIVFRCSRDQCPRGVLSGGLGPDMTSELRRSLAVFGDGSIEDEHYLVASRGVPAGTEYFRIAARGPKLPVIVIDLVQPAALETRVKVVPADSMKSEIAQRGRVSLYALFFDFDRADLKPESKPQLDEIANYLRSDAKINVFVVGHTDGKGVLDYNTGLSRRRATAVVTALINSYQISPGRLSAQGVGPLAPLSTNETEDGRTLNRRVEVVRRLE